MSPNDDRHGEREASRAPEGRARYEARARSARSTQNAGRVAGGGRREPAKARRAVVGAVEASRTEANVAEPACAPAGHAGRSRHVVVQDALGQDAEPDDWVSLRRLAMERYRSLVALSGGTPAEPAQMTERALGGHSLEDSLQDAIVAYFERCVGHNGGPPDAEAVAEIVERMRKREQAKRRRERRRLALLYTQACLMTPDDFMAFLERRDLDRVLYDRLFEHYRGKAKTLRLIYALFVHQLKPEDNKALALAVGEGAPVVAKRKERVFKQAKKLLIELI